ncbi:MAG: M23 family metallopeptidase [Myxococcota bacterium]
MAASGTDPELKEEAILLKTRLRLVQEELACIDSALQRIDQFSAKLRAITRVNDPDRNLAIGPLSRDPSKGAAPVLYAKGERIEYEDELMDSSLALRLIDSKLDTIDSESLGVENRMRGLTEYFAQDVALLHATPSVRPMASKLMTSSFGVRRDPYTGKKGMHKGIDFAADLGADVHATADGIVVWAGNRGKYGKTVVIDHGYGMQTHYAHLSEAKVEVGQELKRGQVIGAAGNTGLTTGVHLHYEVRFDGLPQDPEKYILD